MPGSCVQSVALKGNCVMQHLAVILAERFENHMQE